MNELISRPKSLPMRASFLEIGQHAEPRRHRGLSLALCGVVLQIFSPLIGLFATIIGMTRTFAAISEGADRDVEVRSSIDLALQFTAAGLILSLIGWGMVLVALFWFRCRTQWLYSWLIWSCFVQLFLLPVGTLLSLALLLYLTNRRCEFVPSAVFTARR